LLVTIIYSGKPGKCHKNSVL